MSKRNNDLEEEMNKMNKRLKYLENWIDLYNDSKDENEKKMKKIEDNNNSIIDILIKTIDDDNIFKLVDPNNINFDERNISNAKRFILYKPYFDVKIKDQNSNRTLLMYRSINNDLKIVKFLVQKEINIHEIDIYGKNAIHYIDDPDIIRFLIELKIDIDLIDNERQTPLHCSIHSMNFKTAELLLEYDVNVNIKNLNGYTPLHLTVHIGDDKYKEDVLKIISKLLKKGCNINEKNNDEENTLHLATKYRSSLRIVNFLIENGIDMFAKDINGLTALHHASKIKVINSLIDKGLDVNSLDNNNMTPLHWAVKKLRSLDIIKLLIERGANIHAVNNKNMSILHVGMRSQEECSLLADDPNVASHLINLGVNINLLDSKGYNALYLAVKNQASFEMISLLLEKGSDPNIIVRNNSILNYAIKNCNFDIVKLLLSNHTTERIRPEYTQHFEIYDKALSCIEKEKTSSILETSLC